MQVLRTEGVIEEIDYKGEGEEGLLATFAANRYYDLTKDFASTDELKTRLLALTRYDEIGKVCKKATVTSMRYLSAFKAGSTNVAFR